MRLTNSYGSIALFILAAGLCAKLVEAKEIEGSNESKKPYDELIKQVKIVEQLAKNPNSNFEKLGKPFAVGRAEATQRKFIVQYAKALTTLLKIARLIIPKKASPEDKRLTALAMQLSKEVRKMPIASYLPDFPKDKQYMTPKNIKILKELMSKKLKHNGNQFMDILKNKSKDLHCKGLSLKQWVDGENFYLNKLVEIECGKVSSFSYWFKETAENLRSRNRAIQLVKDMAILVDTLQKPSAFDSMESLMEALSKSRRLHAHATLIGAFRKCVKSGKDVQHNSHLEKDFNNIFKEFQNVIAAEKTPATIHMAHIFMPHIPLIAIKPIRNKVRECVADSGTMKRVAMSSKVLLSNRQLQSIKAKNPTTYALLYLLNDRAKGIRARDGFSGKAKRFVKKYATVSNYAILMQQYLMSPDKDMKERSRRIKIRIIDDFNALPLITKYELVERFPFRILAYMVYFN